MKFIYTLLALLLISCSTQKNLNYVTSEIDEVEIFEGFPDAELKTTADFQERFIADLIASKEVGPTKFIITHSFLIHHSTGKIDTIFTNGIIHNSNGWFKSKENLIEKYTLEEQEHFSDTINGQIRTVRRLKYLMDEKKYEEAILLFSEKEQISIRNHQKDDEIFGYWTYAWTLHEAKFNRYIANIKKGKGRFAFENYEWKIDEK